MLDAASKTFFHLIARSRTLKRLASRYGMREGSGFARRFIAGESVPEAIAAARQLQAAGLTVTLDYLGEAVATVAEADAATRAYLAVIDEIAAAGIERNVSLKLTQLGLTIDRATSVDNLRRILDAATAKQFFVRIEWTCDPAQTEALVQRVFQEIEFVRNIAFQSGQVARIREALQQLQGEALEREWG